MSMELIVIIALQDVPNSNELNSAAIELNTPIAIESEIDLSKHRGFLPVKLEQNDSVIEFYLSPYSEYAKYFPEQQTQPFAEPVVITFRWGGDFQEASVAMYIAYVLSESSDTIVFEPQGGTFLDSTQLLEGAYAMKDFTH